MSGQIGEKASDLIPGDQRIGVKEVRRALMTGELWEAMKTRMREEEPPLIAQAQDANEIQERAEIAVTLANLWNKVSEIVADERQPEMPGEEPARAQFEEHERRTGREDRGTAATQIRARVPIHSTVELRPPVRTETFEKTFGGKSYAGGGESRKGRRKANT